jgi:hypothetical protein
MNSLGNLAKHVDGSFGCRIRKKKVNNRKETERIGFHCIIKCKLVYSQEDQRNE